MSADLKARKRKSGDDVVPSPKKKAKTVKSAESPAPLKSALKKSKVETIVEPPKTKSSKVSVPAPKQRVVEEPQEEADNDEEAEDGEELSADRTAELLAGFSSSDDEASGGEDDGDDDGIAISKLPAAPIESASKKLSKATTASDPEQTPGVVYISRIPHGFYEKQMRAYFSQFGIITHLRLSRNKRTGKSQHYAFVEFESSAVANIVAKTMDKYLLFGHILQCRAVPPEQVKEGMWKTRGKVKNGKVRPRNRIEGSRLRRAAGREQWQARVEREEKRRREKGEKMKELGYEFEMPDVRSVDDVPVRKNIAEIGEAEDGGVKLIEEKATVAEPGVEEKIERVTEVNGTSIVVTEQKIVKQKSKTNGPTTTEKQKKRKSIKTKA